MISSLRRRCPLGTRIRNNPFKLASAADKWRVEDFIATAPRHSSAGQDIQKRQRRNAHKDGGQHRHPRCRNARHGKGNEVRRVRREEVRRDFPRGKSG